jgi:hypothetical protein
VQRGGLSTLGSYVRRAEPNNRTERGLYVQSTAAPPAAGSLTVAAPPAAG